MSEPPRLRVIQGGRSPGRRVAGVRVCAAPLECPPFPVDAVVYQEDTFGVLAAPGDDSPVPDHPVRVFHAAAELEPSAPGTIFVVEEQPVRIHAVVCDLDAGEPCRLEWISAAFARALCVTGDRGHAALGAELLGAAYGHLPVEVAGAVLLGELERSAPACLERLWLIVPGGIDATRVFP